MASFRRLIPRLLVAAIPVVLALLHVFGLLRWSSIDRLDHQIYDLRLKATMPQSLDDRIVIVDIDERSLAEIGRWPWSRDRLAQLVQDVLVTHRASVLGFDIVFAEPDRSSGLHRLQQLASGSLADVPGLASAVEHLRHELDYDGRFAHAIAGKPVVLGHYFTSDREGRTSGKLPQPVMTKEALGDRKVPFFTWTGYGANLGALMDSAASGGYFNAITDEDGVVRSVPLVSEFQGAVYESFALAVFRQLFGASSLEPGFPPTRFLPTGYQGLESVVIRQGDARLHIPVDHRVSSLIPFRGPGGPKGGSFRYVSAADVLQGRLTAGSLQEKIVLVGTTAPGLLDLRVTPVGNAYPGVEAHANLISGFLDGRTYHRPDYALGYELTVVVVCGLLLALLLPVLSAARALSLSAALLASVVGLNFWLYLGHGLVLPLASALVMVISAFSLNMAYGYFAESRSKRELAHLFGTYVPPELVDEMVKNPDAYSMQATARELTVMFCDMRGFTRLSETLPPEQLQDMLNRVFSRLTGIIRDHRGTIDKYMGDCIMAFWGAPVTTPDHAPLAVRAALAMTAALKAINADHAARGLPPIGLGLGLNTGNMLVGDMGSDIRRSYTVIGDAVNVAARLEALARVYGVDIVVGDHTRAQSDEFAWQELDRVVVKGREEALTIHTPRRPQPGGRDGDLAQELSIWTQFLRAYRAQDWAACDLHLLNLDRLRPSDPLYGYYSAQVQQRRALPPDPQWDGITRFSSK